MSERLSVLRRIALTLVRHAFRALPPARSEWGQAMSRELDHIESDWRALRWSVGCVVASYTERGHERPKSLGAVARKPSAFLPMAMSLAAFTIVLVSIGIFGVVHETDEGATAHIWQLLMAGQMPVLAFFIVKWLPRAPRQTLLILAFQIGAALTAMAPVYYLKL